MFCTSCGAKISENAKFCTGCGKGVSENSGLVQKKRKLLLNIYSSIILVLFLSVSSYFLVTNDYMKSIPFSGLLATIYPWAALFFILLMFVYIFRYIVLMRKQKNK